MTTAADDRAVEEAFEACLAGRPASGGAAGLAAFAAVVREVGAQPGRPNAALAELLATGLLTDQSSPSTRTAPAAGNPPRVRNRRRFAMILPVLLAKFLSAGAVAQAATGAGVVVVAVAGAGTAGVLPDPVQDTFTSLVSDEVVVETPEDVTEDVTGDDALDEGVPADPAEIPAVPVDDADGAVDAELGTQLDEVPVEDAERELWAENGPAEGESFGSWVARGARNGWVDGATVSEWAQKRNEERRRAHAAERAAGADQADQGTAEEGDAEGADAEGTDAAGTTEETTEATGSDRSAVREGNRSRGNGQGNGRGNGRG